MNTRAVAQKIRKDWRWGALASRLSTDGRIYTWLRVRKQTGRGEASSGLGFDRIVSVQSKGDAIDVENWEKYQCGNNLASMDPRSDNRGYVKERIGLRKEWIPASRFVGQKEQAVERFHQVVEIGQGPQWRFTEGPNLCPQGKIYNSSLEIAEHAGSISEDGKPKWYYR